MKRKDKLSMIKGFLSYSCYLSKLFSEDKGVEVDELSECYAYIIQCAQEMDGIRQVDVSKIPVSKEDDENYAEAEYLADNDKAPYEHKDNEVLTGHVLVGSQYYTWVDIITERDDGTFHHEFFMVYGICDVYDMVEKYSVRKNNGEIVGYSVSPTKEYSYMFDTKYCIKKAGLVDDNKLFWVIAQALSKGLFIKEDLYARKNGLAQIVSKTKV